MKIYCKTREYKNILDKYVNRDVWVLCKIWMAGDHWSHNDFWIRLLADNGDSYDCVAAMASSESGFRLISDKSNYFSPENIRTRDKETIKPKEPIEVLTTSDLFCLTEEELLDEASEEQVHYLNINLNEEITPDRLQEMRERINEISEGL